MTEAADPEPDRADKANEEGNNGDGVTSCAAPLALLYVVIVRVTASAGRASTVRLISPATERPSSTAADVVWAETPMQQAVVVRTDCAMTVARGSWVPLGEADTQYTW